MFSKAKPVCMASSLGKGMNSLAFWNRLKPNQKLQGVYNQAGEAAWHCLPGL